MPVARFTASDTSQFIILIDDTKIAALSLDTPLPITDQDKTPAPQLITSVTDKIRSILPLDDRLLVMTDSGAIYIYFDPSTHTWSKPACQYPAVSLTLAPLAYAVATVPSRRLTATYPAATFSLSASDSSALASDIAAACRDIHRQALAASALSDPIICRYRLRDIRGNIIFLSPPILLNPQSTPTYNILSDDRRTTMPFDITAQLYKIHLNAPVAQNDLAASVSRLELIACRRFPMLPDSQKPTLTVVRDTTSDLFIRAAMPDQCTPADLTPSLPADDTHGQTIAVIHRPFSTSKPLDLTPGLTAADIPVNPPRQNPVDTTLASLSAPHTFAAATMATAADTIIFGNLRPLRFQGFKIENFINTASDISATWHAAIAVTFADGSQKITTSQSVGRAPLTLNPIISYPSHDAVSITIILSTLGTVRRTTLPLTPDPTLSHSVYISPSLRPIDINSWPQASSFVIPPEIDNPRPMTSFVAISNLRDPLTPKAISPVGQNEIIALHPFCSAHNSWDYSRLRFAAFTTAAIHTITISPSHKISSTLLDTTPLNSPLSVTASPDGRIFAAARQRLIEVTPSKIKTLAKDISATALAYDPTRSELWASDPTTTTILILDPISDILTYTRDERLTGPAFQNYAILDDHLVNIADQQPRDSTYVIYTVPIDFGPIYTLSRLLTFDITSDNIQFGTLTLHRLNNNRHETTPTLRLTLNGKILHPLTVPIYSPHIRHATLTFQARLAPNSQIVKT